jgi:hypothetical protein
MTSAAAQPHITAAGLILNEPGHVLIVSGALDLPAPGCGPDGPTRRSGRAS